MTTAAAVLRRCIFSSAGTILGGAVKSKITIFPSVSVGRAGSSSSCVWVRWFAKARKVAPSRLPDENLKRVLISEIEFGLEAQEFQGFPFEIVDNPGDQAVILKRKFAGETIHVSVFMDNDQAMDKNEGESDEDDNTSSPDDAFEPPLSLTVMIDKGVGPTLEFSCNLKPNELEIESVELRKQDDSDNEIAYQGPEFTDLDESLQKALHNYLEARGINNSLYENNSLYDVLHEYMLNKDDREYLTWLKNTKDFIEK